MPRPRLFRKINFNPQVSYFKPQGIPMNNIEIVELTTEEIEAYRLRYLENKDQKQAAQKMHTSASTYQRILYAANCKIANALVNGKAIKIINL
ncbi:MAG: DUF134 domain-containing protein [Patescibacteria group bacterium]|nr:DUF134 domain-containing protein [Patescibacteria group bacterium]MDD4444048.1 DUF134 domain-containing protein [Patescibacteria group bacterium]